MNNKKLLGIIIAAIVLVVLVVWGTRSGDNNLAGSPGTSPQVSSSASPSVRITAPSPAIKPLTYQEALNKYGNTRFQFDAACQAAPTRMVIKKGSLLMLDNRADVARTITVGMAKYPLLKYGFRVFVPTAPKYPATFLIDCGTQQNVATLVIER